MALTDGLISYWKLDESSGNASDATGNGNTLTNTNVTYSAGKINNGANFNGSNSNLSTGDNSNLRPSSVTVSYWVKTTQGGNHLVKKSSGNGGWEAYSVKNDSSNNDVSSRVQLTGSPSFSDIVTNTVNIKDGNWHMVTMSYTSGSHKIYIDGIERVSSSPSGNIFYVESRRFVLGSSWNTVGYEGYFNGQIDEVGVWNRALSGSEVSELYNGGAGLSYPFTPPAPIFNPALGRRRLIL